MSLDNIWFTKNSLSELANEFHAFGGTHLFIDKVHRYPALHIVFTGSSILEIYKSNADLSRRAISYHLYGLSFREFLNFETQLNFPVFTLKDILTNHINIVSAITTEIKVLPMLKKYIEYGYYPFYKEGIKSYGIRLQNVVNTILDNDLPSVENVEYHTIIKIKKMLHAPGSGMSLMNKPEKIYLDNTNLIYALAVYNVNEGNARETFFAISVLLLL